MRAHKHYFMMALGMIFLCALNAPALTIETHFIGGEAPANVVGKGNLNDIVNAAARIWESVYSDSITLMLYYGWADTGNAGTHSLSTQGGAPNREISGTILFDNSGAASFFLDETPYLNEEYRKITEESQDLGGGYINAARVFSNPTGDAVGHLDLLSVVLHEMGHALGLSAANTSFIENTGTGLLHVSNDLPFAETAIPLAYNHAGIVAHFDVDVVAYGSLMAGINADERRLPSELDILANAQISNLTIIRLRADQTDPSKNTENDDNRGLARHPNTRGTSESERVPGERKVRDIRDSLPQLEMR
jgi:hypothetical protein